MDHPYTGGSWTMIPNVPSHSSSPATHSNQDQFYLHPQSQLQSQQFNQFQQQQQQQNQQQQFQQQQRLIQQQQQQQQNQHHQSLASHFHLLHLVENLAEVIDNGSRDQHSDALTVEGQKRKLEDSEQLLNQRRDLISKYRNSVEELLKSDP
ncbi:mediator of RNA polymerase II transcription subunit 9 isoform X2 [Ricinus communis]|uniref:mediator of RNA polymerase II transcription subunit 9 isoform X2 n=1 Tax=Ricinus communis TaxID=3988 RepID=UPI0007726692|nr:mediator of RNA polymerase II transcription subunit 9 isoform X2 [Ricinus communis]|eukprot:XP_015580230.1 mediator of RNA polymerase II transcription subunit 9 isoform X2 [Ricinus communis]